MRYDIAIVGGGPAGYTAAERAAAGGLKTVLFEKKAIGGVCLNEGCIPTKTLLYSAKLWDTMKGAAKYGITVPDAPASLNQFDFELFAVKLKQMTVMFPFAHAAYLHVVDHVPGDPGLGCHRF